MVSFIHIVLLIHLSVRISLTIQTNEQTYQTCIIKDEHTYQPYTIQGEQTCQPYTIKGELTCQPSEPTCQPNNNRLELQSSCYSYQ